ncbi:MAG: AAA family ATPase [Myxococcota bacterium]
MLLEFRVENFRSLRDLTVLSMEASKDTESRSNAFEVPGLPDTTALRTAAIYGANASGKSNLVRALHFMRDYVLESTRERVRPGERVRMPFRLDAAKLSEPTRFEVSLVLQGVKHTYGFSLDNEGVAEEWWHVHGQRRRRLFERVAGEPVTWGESWIGERKRLGERTRRDALLLTVASESNNESAQALVSWFRNLVVMPSGVAGSPVFGLQPLLKMCHDNPAVRAGIVELLKGADTGIVDVEVAKTEFAKSRLLSALFGPGRGDRPELPAVDWFEVTTKRASRGPAGEPAEVSFDFEDESDGTQRFLELLHPVLQALAGVTVVADELDLRLHPLLIRQLLELVTEGAGQLIFTTHTTDLLGAKRESGEPLLRRDQIWLTEKDNDGATKLFSLWDIQGVRRTEDVRERYLRGLYGGVPRITLQAGEALRERQ